MVISKELCHFYVPSASRQVFEHRLAEAINRLRETLYELTVQKKGIKLRDGERRRCDVGGLMVGYEW